MRTSDRNSDQSGSGMYSSAIHPHFLDLDPDLLDGFELLHALGAGLQMSLTTIRERRAFQQVRKILGFEMSKHIHFSFISLTRFKGSFTSFRSFSRAKNTLAFIVETERFDIVAISS